MVREIGAWDWAHLYGVSVPLWVAPVYGVISVATFIGAFGLAGSADEERTRVREDG